jgi:hypothetical protein
MKYRFIYLMFMLFSATVSSAFATSSKKKRVTTPTLEVGLSNWKPAMPLIDPGHGPHTPNGGTARASVSTTPTYSNAVGASVGVQYLQMLSDHIGIYVGTEYMQQTFTVSTVTPTIEYAYKHLQVPIILTFMPSQYIYVGVGAKYSYLLTASVAGKAVTLANNNAFNRNGIGLIADLSFGWSVKSPRLGIQYIYNTGAALVGQNYGTIDVSLRVPFWSKK